MAVLFEDNFTGGIKPEWEIVAGIWTHNSEFNALQVSLYEGCSGWKNKIKANIITPDDVLVECKIVKLNVLQNTYFDLLNRHIFENDSHSGYSLAYMEVYSRLYNYGLFLIRWDNNSRKGYLVERGIISPHISGFSMNSFGFTY